VTDIPGNSLYRTAGSNRTGHGSAAAAGGDSDRCDADRHRRRLGHRGDVDVSFVDEPGRAGAEKQDCSRHAFGAVFVEVDVDPKLGTVKVPRIVAAYAAGRIPNAKTARSQFLGGLVFAHGMALLEETITDPRTGRVINADLSEYLVPVNADIHSVEVITVPEVDEHVNPIGEIGIVGAPAAIVNAIIDANGKRVRDLPVTPDKLL
jgi:xanthine dehydrogenase YagR molybdenum-binding subunit